MFTLLVIGAVQGIITGIRGLCNGLGPALFGLMFFIFHVDLDQPKKVQDTHSNVTSGRPGRDPSLKVSTLHTNLPVVL